uniref:Ycf54 n=1 Tax=Laurencia catarinensis TaxID=197326 RepID=UPI0028D06A68|nr:Ycf54 [Laurencia catarinensis]WMP12387.1 Ycf54 [Laurencia catarinensis]
MYNYYFAIASKDFFLYQEPIEEILRERTKYYRDINKELDFWFTLKPDFISLLDNKTSYFSIPDSLAAIVSLDKDFIQWLKLRVGFVYVGSFQSKSIFLPD